MVKKY